jgi:hypothetical protein
MLNGIVGRALNVDEEVDITPFVGRPYLIVVAASENGTRVEAVIAAPAA